MKPLNVVIAQRECKTAETLARDLQNHFKMIAVARDLEEMRRTVPKHRADVAVLNLPSQLWLQRDPLCRALAGPAARSARRAAGESCAAAQGLHDFFELHALLSAEAGGKPDMVEFSGAVVEAQQQRANVMAFAAVAKASDHAIGGAQALDLDHGRAFAGAISATCQLGHHAITSASDQPRHPALQLRQICRRRTQLDRR